MVEINFLCVHKKLRSKVRRRAANARSFVFAVDHSVPILLTLIDALKLYDNTHHEWTCGGKTVIFT